MKKTWAIVFSFIFLMFTAVAWAAPVPDTGQTKCYNNSDEIPCPSPGEPFYGQDANYSINPMSYTKLGADGVELPDSATEWIMVKDNVTGLIWENKTDDGSIHDKDNTYTWYDSNPVTNGGDAGDPTDGTNTETFIKALNDTKYGGFSDWRMPIITELSYLVNHSIPKPTPKIDTEYFQNTQSSYYWSSTTFSRFSGLALISDLDSGQNSSSGKGGGRYVRAVRGGQSGLFDTSTAATNYIYNSDGTITDTSTGLMWQREDPASTMTWEGALSHCEGLNLGGYTDWRLPTLKELQSIVDRSLKNPAINTSYFDMNYYSDTAASVYLSSTTYVGDMNTAHGVEFHYGEDTTVSKSSSWHVRAVRGGTTCSPKIKNASADPSELWPPNGKMVKVTIDYSVKDKCGQPECQISNVTSDEPINSSDYNIINAHHVKLRADRLGKGNGRVYKITITCTDDSGNSSNKNVKVTVPHDQGKN